MLSRPVPSASNSVRVLLHRMVRTARLDNDMFQSLKEDAGATLQSILVLALAGLSFGIGFAAWIGYGPLGVLLGAAVGVVASLVFGFAWLSLTFLIGTRLFRGASNYWELARPVFFSSSPGLLFLFMSVSTSPVPEIARALGFVWIAIASVFAMRNALGLDMQRSLVVFITATFVFLLSYGLIASL